MPLYDSPLRLRAPKRAPTRAAERASRCACLLKTVNCQLEVCDLELQGLHLGAALGLGGLGGRGPGRHTLRRVHVLLLRHRRRASLRRAQLLGGGGAATIAAPADLDAGLLHPLLRVVLGHARADLRVMQDLHPLDELEVHLEVALAQLLHLDVPARTA